MLEVRKARTLAKLSITWVANHRQLEVNGRPEDEASSPRCSIESHSLARTFDGG